MLEGVRVSDIIGELAQLSQSVELTDYRWINYSGYNFFELLRANLAEVHIGTMGLFAIATEKLDILR